MKMPQWIAPLVWLIVQAGVLHAQTSGQAQRDIMSRLERTRIESVDFSGKTLSEALHEVLDSLGLPVQFDPGTQNDHDPNAQAPALRLTGLSAKTVLKLLLEPQGLTLVYRDGSLWVVGKNQLQGQYIVRRYDIRDLTYAPPSFPGPSVQLASPDSYGSGGSGLSGALFGLDDDGSGGADPANIQDLIKKHTGSEKAWEEPASIEEIQGSDGQTRFFIINQTAEVHREIQELLSLLRQFK
jgi:hypothetical protein